jgi:hypothetical protein
MTGPEKQAVEALETAVRMLSRAAELSERAGYGSQVTGPLADALRDARYALDTAQGRT